MPNIVAIDIGGTNLRIALGREDGTFEPLFSARTDGPRVMDQIYGVVDDIGGFDGIGIASAGPLDYKNGIITSPPNVDIRNLPITKLLRDRYGKPSYLLNDCVAIAFAEKLFGAGRGVENLVYITISTGIGAGAIVDGRPLLGKDGNAHEVGHFTVDAESTLKCGPGCEKPGHWEAHCSGKNLPALIRLLVAQDYAGRESGFVEHGDFSPEALFGGAKEDPVARDIVDRIGRINAVQVANIINAYDPELITIGGALALKNERLIMDPILKHVENHIINRMPEIKLTPLGDTAGISGAIATYVHGASARAERSTS